jgi:hypothetical protein
MQPDTGSFYGLITPSAVDRDLIYDILLNRLQISFSIRGSVDHFVLDLPSAEMHFWLETEQERQYRSADLTTQWKGILRSPISEVWLVAFPEAAERQAVGVMSALVTPLMPKRSGAFLWDMQLGAPVWQAKKRWMF